MARFYICAKLQGSRYTLTGWTNTCWLGSSATLTFKLVQDIVACQRAGVSNKPLGQRQDTGPGILWSVHRWTRPTGELDNHLDKKFKRNEPHIWFTFFTKTGCAWHVTIYSSRKHRPTERQADMYMTRHLLLECKLCKILDTHGKGSIQYYVQHSQFEHHSNQGGWKR